MPSGRTQISDLIALAQEFATGFGLSKRLTLSISLYYGPPDDPLLLNASQLIRLIEGLSGLSLRTKILFTSHYAHKWAEVRATLGLDRGMIRSDPRTHIPLLPVGNCEIVLFNLSDEPQVAMRVSNEGLTYLGCNHLTLGDRASDFAIDDLRTTTLTEAAHRIVTCEPDQLAQLRDAPEICSTCTDWEDCRGGDRLSGVFFNERPLDPLCSKTREASGYAPH